MGVCFSCSCQAPEKKTNKRSRKRKGDLFDINSQGVSNLFTNSFKSSLYLERRNVFIYLLSSHCLFNVNVQFQVHNWFVLLLIVHIIFFLLAEMFYLYSISL